MLFVVYVIITSCVCILAWYTCADTRHTARFLVLWLWVLPLSLWDRLGWGVIPTTAVVSYLLLGIDEIAIQLVSGMSWNCSPLLPTL